jgi:hypothetical protein
MILYDVLMTAAALYGSTHNKLALYLFVIQEEQSARQAGMRKLTPA